MTRALGEAGAAAKVVVECEFMATALRMAAAGAGACLRNPVSADDARLRGLVVRPFEPAPPSRRLACWSRTGAA